MNMNMNMNVPSIFSRRLSLGNNTILTNSIQTLLDCSNALTITLCQDASATFFFKDNNGYPIKKRSVVSETYLHGDGLTFTFINNMSVTLKDTDTYWYHLSSNRDLRDQQFDISASTPLTLLRNATFIQEINLFFNVVPDVSENNTYNYHFYPEFDPSMNNKERRRIQQTAPKNFISLYLDPSGTLPELDEQLYPVKNRYLQTLMYTDPVSPGANDVLTIVFGNGTKVVSDGMSYWYTASICYSKQQDLSGEFVPAGKDAPSILKRIQYPDHEKFVAFLNSFSNNLLLISAYTGEFGIEMVNDNLGQHIDNRAVTNAVYTPVYVNEATGETENGYATLKFGNNSTLTVNDNTDNNWYSIQLF
jgi:hypothetical protein